MAWGAVTTIQDDDDVLVCSNDESDGSAPQVPGYRMTWGNMQDEEDMFTDGDEPDELEPQPFEENPDEYSDTDADLTHPHGPLTSVEKRRAQNDIFREYATKKMADVIEEEDREAIKNAKDEHLSIQNILAKQETSAQITNPRDYQTELFQKAKAENIIAVLDTGSGKTHIATLLLRHILDVELEARAKGNQHKVAFFLVDSVNLVFQQANVLRCGLDQKVEGICGAMGASLWQKLTWDKHFASNMVIVCTAEVLVQCMMHSFINMSRVNLLIFDEAHHAKNNHPYARLIKDYYYTESDLSKRPRIFSMTASPVDANINIKQAARDLEKLLDSKIVTTSDRTLLANNISRPSEEIVVYEQLQEGFETPLYQHLRSRYGDLPAFEKYFLRSKLISSEIGRWAADKYWSFAFSEDESRKIEMRQEQLHNKEKQDSVTKLNEDIASLKEAAEYVQNLDFGLPTPTAADLSSKVLNLHHWLHLYYARTGDARCIVFVEQRQTARLLNQIFAHIGGPHFHSDMLVGVNSRVGELSVSLRAQVMTVAKFRRGELNCLFSTSVGEEGLDIPQCNLVVRFDLYKTMIAYVQSRGRARHRNSKYLHMLERGNKNHQAMLFHARSSEDIMRKFCNGLSREQVINETDTDLNTLFADDLSFRNYKDPVSGARLTYRSSVGILAHFVAAWQASLPDQNRDMWLQPSYVVHQSGGMFLCEVILPQGSPITSARGLPYKKKSVAKCSAAFEMCVRLRTSKEPYLNENLLPIYQREHPAMRNALLAMNAKQKDLYEMRIKPEFWELGFGTPPERLYLTVVDLSNGLERPHQPIGLVTRERLPQMPRFPIFLKSGHSSDVLTTPLINSFDATEEKLVSFTRFTLQVYRDVFAKKFEYDVSKMTYWLVPIQPEKSMTLVALDDPENVIDWAQIHEVCEKDEYRWQPDMTAEFLADKYIVDNWDGGRRFFSIGVAPQYKAQSPVPSDVPKHKFMADILDYSVSLWSKSRGKCVWNPSQPVIEVEKIPFRRNFLSLVEKDEDEVIAIHRTFVCPEPLRISTLTTRFVAICYVFPAIIYRFESYLTALDACKLLGLDVGPKLALEALTKDSDNSEEHGEEKINLRSGMGPNYERLEFMGDCFLKMATSISTFVLRPDDDEFHFHVRRMVMLCNKNLFDTAMKYKLYEYVRTMAFSRRTWYPEGLKLLQGKGMKRVGSQVMKHSLGDKSVADVCEAFIGAAFMEHNKPSRWDPKDWDQAVKAVKVMVDSEDHLMENWADYYAAYVKPKYQLAEATASQLDLAEKIEKKHPYHFKYPRLLRSAFLHPSQAFMWEHVPNYQRLEFLGDSLLDQVFISHLFYRFPHKDPQWLTEHKMPMVSNRFLGAVCVKLGFYHHIRQNNSSLSAEIRDYVGEIEEAEHEPNAGPDYWVHINKDPPKCLADVVEAYVGAMFVDSEFDFSVVQTFFDMHIKHYFSDISLYDDFGTNKLTRLMKVNFGCTEWRLDTVNRQSVIPGARDDVIAMLLIHSNIYFDGRAVSSRYAKQKASRAAMQKLEGLPRYEFRKQYGCDCKDDISGLEKGAAKENSAQKYKIVDAQGVEERNGNPETTDI